MLFIKETIMDTEFYKRHIKHKKNRVARKTCHFFVAYLLKKSAILGRIRVVTIRGKIYENFF